MHDGVWWWVNGSEDTLHHTRRTCFWVICNQMARWKRLHVTFGQITQHVKKCNNLLCLHVYWGDNRWVLHVCCSCRRFLTPRAFTNICTYLICVLMFICKLCGKFRWVNDQLVQFCASEILPKCFNFCKSVHSYALFQILKNWLQCETLLFGTHQWIRQEIV